MMVKDLREFVFENYYKQICFSKMDNYYSLKNAEKFFGIICQELNGKILDPNKARD